MKLEKLLTKYIKQERNRDNVKNYLERFSLDEETQKFILYETLSYVDSKDSIHNRIGIMDRLENRQFLFEHDAFKEIKALIKEQEDFLHNPIEVDDGVIECHKCHSHKTFSYTKQTRASDEGTTVFVTCANCRHQFRL
jgi:DNA-directed RNA polymerase subunit M/transcription elongation factor TFIIS